MPVVTAALTHSLSMAGYLLLDPGDTLIVPDLAWDNYDLMFSTVYGARLQEFPTFQGERFNVAALVSALRERKGKKLLLLNFPNNPTGYTPTVEEAHAIADAIRAQAERGDTIGVVVDDAYFGLVYEEGVYRESLVALLADLHERVVVFKVDGATKEDYVWGHRVGFLSVAGKGMGDGALQAMEAKIAGAVRSTVSNAPHLSQTLLLQVYRSPTYAAEKQRAYDLLAERYRTVREVLSDTAMTQNFTPLPFNSGYFMCVRVGGDGDAEAVRQRLLRDFDTGVIAFGDLLRIAYSSVPTAQIPTLFSNIHAACVA
jgi:aspartate/methionine/tyrosine aminotransferase